MERVKSMLDTAHHYLQRYCVIEIAVIGYCCFMNYQLIDMYFTNLERLKEWDIAALVSFHAATIGIIKSCLDSINVDIK